MCASKQRRKRFDVLYYSIYQFASKVIDVISDIFLAEEIIRKNIILGSISIKTVFSSALVRLNPKF